jgi:hypothetical protein
MAFVLLAIMIFFAMVSLIYFSIRLNALRGDAQDLQDSEAKELVRRLAGSAEFRYDSCDNCIDLDKVLILSEQESYKGFWNLDYLRVDVVYPERSGECSKASYPDCKSITVIQNDEDFGIPSSSFVNLCRRAFEGGEYYGECSIGRIYASGRELNG